MKKLLALVVLLGLADDKDFFPLKEGTKWTYVWEDKKEDVVVVEGKKTIDDVEYTVLKFDVQDNASTRREYYAATDDGIFCYGCNLENEDEADDSRESPFPIVKLGAKKGDMWEHKDGDRVTKYEHMGEDEVAVPAGKYKAIKIVHTGDIAGTKNVTTEWFAKGVGIVKKVSDTGGSVSTMELKSVK